MTDEFEQRLQTDFIFNGCKQDVIDLWLSNRSNWYPTTLIGANISGSGHCIVTGASCSWFTGLPPFCRPGESITDHPIMGPAWRERYSVTFQKAPT
jgi:hypothetical protein